MLLTHSINSLPKWTTSFDPRLNVTCFAQISRKPHQSVEACVCVCMVMIGLWSGCVSESQISYDTVNPHSGCASRNKNVYTAYATNEPPDDSALFKDKRKKSDELCVIKTATFKPPSKVGTAMAASVVIFCRFCSSLSYYRDLRD